MIRLTPRRSKRRTAAASRDLGEGATIQRNTALSLAAQLVPALLTFVLFVYLVRALGPDSYGEFALAMAIGMFLLEPSDLGLSQSAARFVAEHRRDAGAVTSILSDSLRLKLVSSLGIALGMFVLAGPISAAFDEPGIAWPLRGMALAVFAQGLMTFWNTAFVALRRVSLTLRVVVSESVAEVVASVALVALGAGATGAAFGRAIGFGFGALVALVLVHRLLGARAITVFGGGHGQAGKIVRYAGVMLVVETAYSAWSSVNALVIGWLLGATAVGLFSAPFRLISALTYGGIAVAQAVAPRMSRAGQGPDARSFASATRLLIMLQLAFAIPIAVWAAPITNLVLGDAYDESVGVMRTLALLVFIGGFSPLFSVSVNYLGEARWRIPIVLAGFGLNVLLDFALVGTIGIEGAALGATAGAALYTGGHLWICTRADDVGLPLRQLGATLLRSLVAGAMMAAVLFAFGTSTLSLAVMVTGGLAAVAVYIGALLVLGELSRGELKRVRAQVARLAGTR